MYLLVFVSLVVSLVGVYAQVLAVQTARIYANQSGVAQEMLQWHNAALSMAASIIDTNSAGNPGSYYTAAVGAIGCSLTYQLPPNASATAGFTTCQSPINQSTGVATNPPVGGQTTSAGTIIDYVGSSNIILQPGLIYNPNDHPSGVAYVPHNECVHIPATCNLAANHIDCATCTSNYNMTNQFYSVLYQAMYNGSFKDFVVTFVIPPAVSASNPAPSFAFFPGGASMGLSISDLMQQLQHSVIPSGIFYGTINNTVSPPVLVTTTNGVYPLAPAFASFGNSGVYTGINGAIAVIGSPDGL